MEDLKATIRYLLTDFTEQVLPGIADGLIKRDLSLGKPTKPKIGSTAKVVVGMRRSGKTFRLYQEILALCDAGVEDARICYFNFDDDRLRPYATTLVSDVLETFYEMNPAARTEGAYLFFDEVQDVPGWDVTVRRILDTEKVCLYVTGSSSRMLSEDVATEFRGRSISYELLPYSFREYLRCRGNEPALGRSLNSRSLASLLKKELRAYLVEGGFPAAQELDDLERAQLLQGYAQLTVARDVVERFGFSNSAYARSLARTVITSSARDVSISRLSNKGKEAGYTPGRAAVTELIDAFEDAHLAYQLFEFSYSAQKVRLGGLKLYAADPGLYWASSIATADGLAFAFETAVYLELRRRRHTGRLGDIAMLKLASGKEVDFVEGDAAINEASVLVQVCFDMSSPKTEKREVSALEEAMERFGCGQALIVTFDDERDIKVTSGTIQVRPAWKWLLEAEKGRIMAFDYKKEQKDIYRPRKRPSLIQMPSINYVAVSGEGDPNVEDGSYQQALNLLYGVSFTIKMAPKAGNELEGYFEYVVPPLEGFWKIPDGETFFDPQRKSELRWTSCIRLPEFVTPEILEWAKAEAARKKKMDFSAVEFITVDEGLCVQCMHMGPYDDEPATIALMEDFAESEGHSIDLGPHRLHHEVYLSDPRRTAPEKLKTIIRLPIK